MITSHHAHSYSSIFHLPSSRFRLLITRWDNLLSSIPIRLRSSINRFVIKSTAVSTSLRRGHTIYVL